MTESSLSRLVVSPRHLQAIALHAASTYPEECCGFLVGHAPANGRPAAAVVARVLPTRNERDESRGNRFLIAPDTVLAAHREARSQGLDVIGYYHSHPDHPAVPSDFDREHAWPDLSYLIVPVAAGTPGPARSWRLADDRGGFDEEVLQTAGEPPLPLPHFHEEALP